MLKELLLMKCSPGKILNTPKGLSISQSFPLTANLEMTLVLSHEEIQWENYFGLILIEMIFILFFKFKIYIWLKKVGQGNLSEFDNFVFLEKMFDISTFYKMH